MTETEESQRILTFIEYVCVCAYARVCTSLSHSFEKKGRSLEGFSIAGMSLLFAELPLTASSSVTSSLISLSVANPLIPHTAWVLHRNPLSLVPPVPLTHSATD